jgi:hypothetical protein
MPPGVSSAESAELRRLKRENAELRPANEILSVRPRLSSRKLCPASHGVRVAEPSSANSGNNRFRSPRLPGATILSRPRMSGDYIRWNQERLRRRPYLVGRSPISAPACRRSTFHASCAAVAVWMPRGTAT